MLPDPLGLFSSRAGPSGPGGFGPGGPLQALSTHFSNFMSAVPGALLPGIFSRGESATTPGTPHSTSPSPGGTAPFTTPSGVPLPPHVAPPGLSGHPAHGSAPTMPAPGNGLLQTTGNVLNAATDTVRNLLSPPGQPPGGPMASASANAGTTPGGVPAHVANAATDVARTVVSNLTPSQAPVATQAPGSTQTAGLPAALGQANVSGLPQTAQAGLPAQASSQAPQAAPVPSQVLPARADGAPVPLGTPAADRAALAQAPQTPSQPALPATAPGASLVAALPLAATMAQPPVAAPIAGNPQAQAAGQPVAGNAALDAGGAARAELAGTGTYTADGPGLRRRQRMKVGAQQMGQWMLAVAQGRLHLVRPHDDSRHEAERVFQWLFWILAIVAYGSLALVLVAFLLSLGELPAAPTLRRWTGEFAFAGLLAAGGAWWLGRQLTRAARPPPDPMRR